MTTANIEVRQAARSMGAFDETDNNLIRYLGLNVNNPKDQAAVAVCKHYGFDPLLKHVVVIDGVYITRDGLLHVAHRSGQLDGIVVEQDPTFDVEENEWKAKVSVYRKDMSHPFTFPGRYPAEGGNKKYAQEMALKSAEAHALRRAFDVTGLPVLDEQQPGTAAPQPAQSAQVTSDEITAPRKPKQRRAEPDTQTTTYDAGTNKTVRQLFALLAKGDVDNNNRPDRIAIYQWITDNPRIASTNDLDDAELKAVVDQLNTWDKQNELGDKITEILNTASLKAANEKEAHNG